MKQGFTIALLLYISLAVSADSFTLGGLLYDINPDREGEVSVMAADTPYAATSVDIPDSVTYGDVTYHVSTIAPRAFYAAPDLEEVHMPYVEKIGRQAFASCAKLRTVELGTKLTALEDGVFSRDKALTYIDLPSSLRSMGEYMFDGCAALEEVECNHLQLDEIPPFTFRDCINLKSVSWPEGVKSIGAYAFANCDLGRLHFPSTLSTIEEYAFSNCDGIERIYLTGDSLEIKDGAFSYCSMLDSVQFAGVKRIGAYAFSQCNVMRQVTFYPGLEDIATFAFSGCSSLSLIECLMDLPPVIYPTTFDAGTNVAATLVVPDDCVELYKQTGLWDRFLTIRSEKASDPDGVDDNMDEEMQISLSGGNLTIYGATRHVAVYDLMGHTLYSSAAHSGDASHTHEVTLPAKGLYTVVSGSKTVKIIY